MSFSFLIITLLRRIWHARFVLYSAPKYIKTKHHCLALKLNIVLSCLGCGLWYGCFLRCVKRQKCGINWTYSTFCILWAFTFCSWVRPSFKYVLTWHLTRVDGVLYCQVIILVHGFTLYLYNLPLTKHTVKIHKKCHNKITVDIGNDALA